ncbi:MAG: hypothetical protein ABW061_22775 [Polyangiaceae bacterium]
MRLWGRAISLKQKTQRAPAAFGLLALVWFGAPVILGACADDGNGAGSAGHANGGNGDSAGQATDGRAGAAANGGGGKADGGAPSCDQVECFRANVCLDQCGGKVLYSGCCACGEGTVEELSCGAAGGSGGSGGSGGASSACAGRQTCAPGQACVGYRAIGGAVILPDADGKCAITKHLEDGRCQNDFTYTCAELSGCSAPDATCRCEAHTACGTTNVCRLPMDGAWLDKAVVLVCELQVP